MPDIPNRTTRCSHGFLPPLCPQCDAPPARKLSRKGNWTRDARGSRRHVAYQDMMGVRVGRLVVVNEEPRGRHGTVRWRCHCDCGGEHVCDGVYLRAVLKAEAERKREAPLCCPRCKPKARNTLGRWCKPGSGKGVLV